MEERSQGLLQTFKGALPGVLVLRSLEKLDFMNDEAFYVQFNHEGFSSKSIYLQATRFVSQLKKLMEDNVRAA